MTALVEFDAEPLISVDLPTQRQPIDATTIAARMIDKQPIVPPWMRSWAEARALAVWALKYGAHIAGYQIARIPL